MKCLYNITDVRTGKVLHKGLCVRNVNAAIGISRNCVYSYAERGLIYKKIYLIHNVGKVKKVNDNFSCEWNQVTEALLKHSETIRNISIVQKKD